MIKDLPPEQREAFWLNWKQEVRPQTVKVE